MRGKVNQNLIYLGESWSKKNLHSFAFGIAYVCDNKRCFFDHELNIRLINRNSKRVFAQASSSKVNSGVLAYILYADE